MMDHDRLSYFGYQCLHIKQIITFNDENIRRILSVRDAGWL